MVVAIRTVIKDGLSFIHRSSLHRRITAENDEGRGKWGKRRMRRRGRVVKRRNGGKRAKRGKRSKGRGEENERGKEDERGEATDLNMRR